MTLDNVDLSVLGYAKKIEVTKDDTIITEGAGEKSNVTERADQILSQIEQSTSD